MTTMEKVDIKEYCNSLYDELSNMKARVGEFVERIEHFKGKDKEMLGSHAPHLKDIIKTIEWKLEILVRACPFDWKGYGEGVEDTVSVPLGEASEGRDRAAGGDIGG